MTRDAEVLNSGAARGRSGDLSDGDQLLSGMPSASMPHGGSPG